MGMARFDLWMSRDLLVNMMKSWSWLPRHCAETGARIWGPAWVVNDCRTLGNANREQWLSDEGRTMWLLKNGPLVKM